MVFSSLSQRTVLSRVYVCVTIDGVWVGEIGLLTTCLHHPELQFTVY
jgi:hypothetical protein